MFADSKGHSMVFTHLVGDEDDDLSAVWFFIRGVQALAVSSSESDYIRSRILANQPTAFA
jgi:hypothetical protein